MRGGLGALVPESLRRPWSRRPRFLGGALDAAGAAEDDRRRRLSYIHHTAGPVTYYNHATASRLPPGPLANYRINADGQLEVWTGSRFTGYEDISGWYRWRLGSRVWWWHITAVIDKLHDDLDHPARTNDD